MCEGLWLRALGMLPYPLTHTFHHSQDQGFANNGFLAGPGTRWLFLVLPSTWDVALEVHVLGRVFC